MLYAKNTKTRQPVSCLARKNQLAYLPSRPTSPLMATAKLCSIIRTLSLASLASRFKKASCILEILPWRIWTSPSEIVSFRRVAANSISRPLIRANAIARAFSSSDMFIGSPAFEVFIVSNRNLDGFVFEPPSFRVALTKCNAVLTLTRLSNKVNNS